MFLNSECIVSILVNLNKMPHLSALCFNKIVEILERDYSVSNFPYIKKIFEHLVKAIMYWCNLEKKMMNAIKQFLKRYFMVYEKDKDHDFVINNFGYEYIIENCHRIFLILINNSETNFKIDFVTYVIKQVFDGQRQVLNTTLVNENLSKEQIDGKVLIAKSVHKVRALFNHKFFKYFTKPVINKHILCKFFQIFQENDTHVAEILLKKFSKILVSQAHKDNDEFFDQFIVNFDHITHRIQNIKDWRLLKEVLHALGRYVKI